MQLVLSIPGAAHAADDETVFVLIEGEAAVGGPDHGVLVTCVGRNQLACGYLQDAQPYGDEHALLVVGADGFVGLLQDLRRALAQHGAALQDDLGYHHEQGRRDALAGHVGHDQSEMVLIDKEEVVEVAAHLLGGVHGGVELEFGPVGEGREGVGHEGRLDAGGQSELRADALPLRRDPGDVPDVGLDLLLHMVDGGGQLPDLILVADHFAELLRVGRALPGEAGGFLSDQREGVQQHSVKVHALSRDHDQRQGDEDGRDLFDVGVAHAGQHVHLSLYAEDGLDLIVRPLEPDHGGDMGIRFDVAFVPDHQLLLRLPIVQGAILFPILVVGGIPHEAEVVLRVVAVVVDGRKEEGDVPIVRAIRLDHVDECGAGGIAEMVHPVQDLQIRRRGPAALSIFVHPVGVHQLSGRPSRQKGALSILLQQSFGKAVIPDGTDDQGKQHQQQHDAEYALNGHMPT